MASGIDNIIGMMFKVAPLFGLLFVALVICVGGFLWISIKFHRNFLDEVRGERQDITSRETTLNEKIGSYIDKMEIQQKKFQNGRILKSLLQLHLIVFMLDVIQCVTCSRTRKRFCNTTHRPNRKGWLD